MRYTEQDRDAATRLAVKTAREDFLAFVLLMDPNFSIGPHHRIIADELMKSEQTEDCRTMIFVPPRSSKSLMSSTYFPAWALGRNPHWQWLQVSHSVPLATKFGRNIRDIIASPMYQAIFPGVGIRRDNRAADDWGLELNGEKTWGQFYAAGAGTGIAGLGAHTGLIDDPISEQDAWSKSKREAVNEWYPGGFRTRLMPGGRLIIIQTRWHEQDLSGFLLEEEIKNPLADKWNVVKIPALNTHESCERLQEATDKLKEQGYLDEDYPDPVVGESFWAKAWKPKSYYWSTEALLRTKNNLPPYQWNALYMQEPSAMDGGIFAPKNWQDWCERHPPECEYIIMSMDTAFSTKETADFSALTVWGIFRTRGGAPNMILLGAEKGRWTYPELKEVAFEKFEIHDPDIILIEKKASGQSLIQDLRLHGLPVMEYQPDRDKEARAHSCSAYFYEGQIWAPKAKLWAQAVIDEARTFPTGAHDDFVDTMTQAILWMRNGSFIAPKQSPWYNIDDEMEISYRNADRRYY